MLPAPLTIHPVFLFFLRKLLDFRDKSVYCQAAWFFVKKGTIITGLEFKKIPQSYLLALGESSLEIKLHNETRLYKMELIKKIKEAEAQAKEIVEEARVEAGRIADESLAERNTKLEEADSDRRNAIETAVAEAQQSGQSEVEALESSEAEKKQTMIDSARQRMDAAVNKIVAAIK